MWISVQGQQGTMPVVRGPSMEFAAVAGDAAMLPASHRAVVLEWSSVYGVLAVFERVGDRFEVLWQSGIAETVRGGDQRPIDFEGRASADLRRQAWKRQRAATNVCDD